jgi:hypothetical protein
VMRSRSVYQNAMGRSLPSTQLTLIRLPHFHVSPCLPGDRLGLLMLPIGNENKFTSFLPPLPPRSSPLELPYLTLAPGSVVPGSTGFNTALRLPGHFLPNGQIFRPAGVMHNAPDKLRLSSVPWYALCFLMGLQ